MVHLVDGVQQLISPRRETLGAFERLELRRTVAAVISRIHTSTVNAFHVHSQGDVPRWAKSVDLNFISSTLNEIEVQKRKRCSKFRTPKSYVALILPGWLTAARVLFLFSLRSFLAWIAEETVLLRGFNRQALFIEFRGKHSRTYDER